MIEVNSDLVQDKDIFIPVYYEKIQLLEIRSSNNQVRTIEFQGCNFFANGVHLVIASSINLENCFLFGGVRADKGRSNHCISSYITIEGKADHVFGGGYAIGPGSTSMVYDTTIFVCGGKVRCLYGGGYGIQGGTVISDWILIGEAKESCVGSLNGGSCLPGPKSMSYIKNISFYLSGTITSDVSLSGYTANGSETTIEEYIALDAEKAHFQGRIYDCKTDGAMNNVSIHKITCNIPQKYKDILRIQSSEIQILFPEPEMPENNASDEIRKEQI